MFSHTFGFVRPQNLFVEQAHFQSKKKEEEGNQENNRKILTQSQRLLAWQRCSDQAERRDDFFTLAPPLASLAD